MGDNLSRNQSVPNVNRVPLVVVLMLGAFVSVLNQTLLGTALPKIMVDLDLTENTGQWLQSAFLLVNGIMIPMTAFFIGRFTNRSLFLTAMGLFSLGTLTSAISGSFEVLLLGRILQAAGAGIIMPLLQTIMMLVFPIEKRGTAMGLFGLVIAFAPAIGPALSGYIVEVASWRWLFWMILPIAIIDIILAYFILKNVTQQTKPKLDVLSIILSTFGFGGILYAFSTAGSAGWGSMEVLLGFGIGIITLIWFITRQFKLEQPMLEFRVLKYKMFTVTTILGMINFIAVIGAAIVLPLYMQTMLGFTPFESGLAFLGGAMIQGVLNPIAGRLFDKFGARWMAISGMLILTISTFMFTVLTPETSFAYIAVTHALRSASISMVMMPVTTAGLNALPTDLISHGTAVNNTLRQIAGSIGTALSITIMTIFTIPEKGIEGMIHGVNISFVFAGITSIIGLIMAFYVKGRRVQ